MGKLTAYTECQKHVGLTLKKLASHGKAAILSRFRVAAATAGLSRSGSKQ
jgi:hypothetical protein